MEIVFGLKICVAESEIWQKQNKTKSHNRQNLPFIRNPKHWISFHFVLVKKNSIFTTYNWTDHQMVIENLNMRLAT